MEAIYKQEFASYNGSVENSDSAQNDANDILASINGDSAAFERLVLRYQQQIAQLCWHFSIDPAVCERLVQDTFVEAFLSLKSYKAKGSFIGWLKKIATRAGYRYWKEQARAKRFVSISSFSDEANDGEDIDIPAPPQKQEIEPDAAAKILHKLLEKLNSSERMVLTLMYLEDCSIKDIAERMGWTIAGTKMRAMRARNKLKKIAEKEKILEKLEWIE